MRNLLAFLKPSWKKMVLPLFLIILPWLLIFSSLIFPSIWTARIALFSLFGFLELPLYALSNILSLNLPRSCGDSWLGLCTYSSAWQGIILISLIYGLIGYLFACSFSQASPKGKRLIILALMILMGALISIGVVYTRLGRIFQEVEVL